MQRNDVISKFFSELKPRSSFRFGNDDEHECKFYFDFTGGERFYVDDKLVFQCWSLAYSCTRQFESHGHTIRIEVGGFKKIKGQAFVDGRLVTDDLFRQFYENIKKIKEKSKSLYPLEKRKLLRLLVEILVYGSIAGIIISYIFN